MALDDRMLARARSFGSVADAYDRLRPGYPEPLFEELLGYARGTLGEVLEIGAGTGKATLRLLTHGLDVVAVEPSAEMARLLRDRAAASGLADRLEVVVGSFEDFGTTRQFGVVAAAQSFHWVDPSTRWQRLAAVLRPGGSAGLFWNAWMLDPAVHEHDTIRRVFDGHGHGLSPDVVPFEVDDSPPDGMADVPALVDFQVRRYDRAWSLDTADYLGLLATTSQFAVLDDAARTAILTPLGDVLGPSTHLVLRTELLLVRRARSPR